MRNLNRDSGVSSEQNGKTAMDWSFGDLARKASDSLGTSIAFFVACAVVVIWAITGPVFHYSDTWQLVINTGTTVVTFLMVFLVQHTQNRDSRALHLKLDEIIRSTKDARNKLMDLENCTDEEMDQLRKQFEDIANGKRAPKH
jgi:low affinity Fe/Cu permease